MNASELLQRLSDRGVGIRADGDELRVRAPKGALSSEDVALLREHKPALLAALRRAGRWGLELSGQQERLWYFERVEEGLTAYVLPGAFRLEGPLRVDLLQQALRDFVERHDLGRVLVRTEEERPVLDFAESNRFQFTQVDAADVLSDPADAAALAEWVADAGDVSLRLDEPPLIRFTLLRVSDELHILLLVVHHVIWDGWGFDIFLREVGECYAARLARRQPALPPVAGAYADFVRDQHEQLNGPGAEAGKRFWGETLAGTLPDLELPCDHPRPPRMTYAGGRVPFGLRGPTLEALRALAGQERVTMFVVLLAVYKVLLHRMTGQDDLIVAVPVQGRGRPEYEQVVGFFVNTLPVRTRPVAALPFREYLRQVHARFLEAIDHQGTPFEWLVRHFGRRDLGRTPIYQAMFTHQHTARRNEWWGDLRVRSFVRGARSVTTDIGLWVREYDDRMDGGLDYRSDLLDKASAAAMAGAYRQLIEAVLADPAMPIGDLPLLDATALAAETTGRRGPRRDATALGSYLDLVAEWALARPGEVAVEDAEGTLTYGALWNEAGAIAAALTTHGVAPGEPVVALVRRSRRLPAVLLGILRAGAVYVPMDAAYPEERLRFMAGDSAARLALVDDSTRALAAAIGLRGLDVSEALASAPVAVSMLPDAEAIAYRIYTSGSTGRPKAVEVPHGALTNFLAGMAGTLAVADEDVLLAVTTVAFDISLMELLLPLVAGARVVVASAEEALDAAALAARMTASRVTMMQATPATWRLLVDAGWAGGLRTALSGGEALPRGLADTVRARCGRLWNLYGPTETTIWSTTHVVQAASGSVPLGRPILNTNVYVLDDRGRPVPQGARGEIWIGGRGVARGYWAREELTAERFRPDPFDPAPGARMYRTGDMGRWRGDGTLEFLGRTDAQVKVQGYRIELQEVEAALEAVPGVREAAVDARGEDADRRLVGWVVPADDADPPTASELRRALRRTLPPFMVPAIIVPVAAMPRTPNGKVDRRRLPDPLRAPAPPREDSAPPVGAMEEAIADEWRRLLGVARVSRHDNFFEIGGYSLLALQAVAAIAQRTGRRIDPRRFFFSTLAQLAEGA